MSLKFQHCRVEDIMVGDLYANEISTYGVIDKFG